MLQHLTMLLSLTGPLGVALISGGYALFCWSQSGDMWWWLVPAGALVFGWWWYRRWRRQWAARVLRRIARGSNDRRH